MENVIKKNKSKGLDAEATKAPQCKTEDNANQNMHVLKPLKFVDNTIFFKDGEGTCSFMGNGFARFDLHPKCPESECTCFYKDENFLGEENRTKNMRFDVAISVLPIKKVIQIANKMIKDSGLFIDISDEFFLKRIEA